MKRFIEIDWLRGVAILLMVVFHGAYNVDYLEIASLDLWSGGWLLVARVVQVIFIATTGMTLVLSYKKGQRQGRGHSLRRRLNHAGVVFGFGMLITLITWVLFKEEAVKFGILHFLGISMVLALPFLRFGVWNFFWGLLVFVGSFMLKGVSVVGDWWFPLGLTTSGFNSLDYFPLFPWFGLFLWGVAWASWFYEGGRRRCDFSLNVPRFISRSLCFLGRRSLLIYLIHQPILMVVIWGVFYLANL